MLQPASQHCSAFHRKEAGIPALFPTALGFRRVVQQGHLPCFSYFLFPVGTASHKILPRRFPTQGIRNEYRIALAQAAALPPVQIQLQAAFIQPGVDFHGFGSGITVQIKEIH